MDTYNNQVDHMKESAEYERELGTLTQALFDISHKQCALGINRKALPMTFNQQGTQLPVLALKPNRLFFSITTADLRI